MATQTTNLGLTLPIGTEHVSRAIINENNQKIDDEFGTLSEQIGNLGSVLWTNSSPTSNFSEGDVSIPNITNWHVVLIQFIENKTVTEQYSMTTVVKVGMMGELVFPTSSGMLFRTFVTYTNQNKIFFGQGGKNGVGFDNQYCVPIKIVGIA